MNTYFQFRLLNAFSNYLTGLAPDGLDKQSGVLVTRKLGVSLLVLAIVAVEPVLAAESGVCATQKLPEMIEGFFQLTAGLGIIGLAVVWQAESLVEMFTLNPEQKKGLKRHKRSAIKSAVVLVTLGPLYTVTGSMLGLPLAECINLAP